MMSSKSSASSTGSSVKLTDFKVLTFDCYGTLIDWESGMIDALKPLTSKASRPLKRDEILEAHARHELSQQVQTPTKLYRDLLATVYRRLAEEWGVTASWSDCVAYGRSIRNWPAFADTASSLQYLKRHYKLAILSNVDNESFSFSNEKLGIDFDAIYTAEDCGSYKPSHRNFDYMLAKLKTLGSRRTGSCIPRRACFTTTGPPMRRASPHAGLIGAMARKAPARRWPRPKRQSTTFASRV